MHAMVRHLADVRRSLPALHAAVESRPVETSNRSVLGVVRRHAAGDVVQLYNCSNDWQYVDDWALGTLQHREFVDRLSGDAARREHGQVVLEPYAAVWLTGV